MANALPRSVNPPHLRRFAHDPGAQPKPASSIPAFKLAFDKVFAVCALVALSPVMLTVAALIALQRDGPVLFGHTRVGRGGRLFKCYKFRTMRPDGAERFREVMVIDPIARDDWQEHRKIYRDPRVSRFGAALRGTSLDELPQFWNVLRGDMSIVGPRPVTPEEVEKYGPNAQDYLSVRPGLTGAWQVNGRSDTSYAERVRLDVDYVRNQSLRRDISIVLSTIKVVASRQGAH